MSDVPDKNGLAFLSPCEVAAKTDFLFRSVLEGDDHAEVCHDVDLFVVQPLVQWLCLASGVIRILRDKGFLIKRSGELDPESEESENLDGPPVNALSSPPWNTCPVGR